MTTIRPKWIIFDAADTLLRPEPVVAEIYKRIASKHGVAVEVDDINDRFQPAMRKHFSEEISDEQRDRRRWRQLVFDVLETDREVIFDELWDYFAQPSGWCLFDDVESTWCWLVANRFSLAIASNFDARLLNIIAAKPSICGASHVFISSRLGFRKPSIGFFREIERQLDASSDELMLVGDSKHADFDGATAAGWQALHLDRSCSDPQLPIISSLSAITTMLC